jgi:hypothetical protein
MSTAPKISGTIPTDDMPRLEVVSEDVDSPPDPTVWFVYKEIERKALAEHFGDSAHGRETFKPEGEHVAIVHTAHDRYAIAKAPETLEFAYRQGARSVRVICLPTGRGKDLTHWFKQWSPDDLLLEARNSPILPAPEPTKGGFVSFVSGQTHTRPIAVALHPVPPMDERLIPRPFGAWIKDIAERASCPLDLPAVSALVSLGAVVGRKLAIRPKRKDDWTVVPNLWGAGVLPPGWLKTHCLDEPKKPLARLEAEARDAHELALQEHRVQLTVAEAEADAAKAELKAAAKNKRGDLAEIARRSLSKPDIKPPTLRRYIVNDSTVEAIGVLLAENPNGLLVYRDELMGFLKSLEKQGHENDRAFYLEAWNGLTSYSYFYSRRNLTPGCLARQVLACDLRATSFRRRW